MRPRRLRSGGSGPRRDLGEEIESFAVYELPCSESSTTVAVWAAMIRFSWFPSTGKSLTARVRDAGLVAILLAASIFFASFVNQFYAIRTWLFWRYAFCWIVVSCWTLCCLALGYEILARLFRRRLPKVEHLTLGLPVGVLAFGLGIFCLGLAHALNRVTFFALPLACAAPGWRRLVTDLRRLRRRMRLGPIVSMDLRAAPIVALAALALALLYFQQLSPEVFSFDVRWYHIPMAQRYAISGAIESFKEGFWPGAFPQLLTYFYTWVFLMPHAVLFDRLEVCSHLEFVLFLATLAQIPVFVRRMVPHAKVGLTWITLLAFPSIYLYDGNLHAGADHVAGFWAIPIALVLRRAWRSFSQATVLLFAAFIGGAALTKYTALPLVSTAGVALFARGVWLCARSRSAATLRALGTLIFASAAITAPHWMKNWIWYGNPAYPWLYKYLGGRPWNSEVPSQLAMLDGVARPGSLTWHGLFDALQATVTFSFVPNDWEFLHRDVPVFGSLFTLTLPALFFLRRARGLWWVYAWNMSVVFCWYLLTHYDRYLQAALPAMAAATAACLVLCWDRGLLARVAVILLVGLQMIWGGDVPFFRTHNLIGDSPIRYVAMFLASGFEKTQPPRVYEPLTTVGMSVPPDATVLAHDVITILGIDRNWVTDLHQSKFSYARLVNPAAIHAELRGLGVTHLMWSDRSINRDSVAGDLAFLNYAANYVEDKRKVGGFTIGRLPATAPLQRAADYRVANFGCGRPYFPGWYMLSQLTLPMMNPGPAPSPRAELEGLEEANESADLVVIDTQCGGVRWVPNADFVLASTRTEGQLYVRTRPRPLVDHP